MKYPRFDFIAADGQMVVAPPLVARTKASKPVLTRHDASCAADTTLREAREQVLRALRSAEMTCGPDRVPGLLLTIFRSRPQIVGQNPKFRDFFRIHSDSALRRDTRFPGSGFFT